MGSRKGSQVERRTSDVEPSAEGHSPSGQTTGVAQSGSVLEGINFNGTQSGEDVRQRGWFWHWNELHTEYGPLLQHSGIGLITSYIVWTDRREHSPYRGYAFPSLQTQAAFSGSDRAELITINRILVALDLIEIRKEMISHTNERGHKLKTPHNLYRVKDRSGDPHLTTRDVVRVLQLAAERNDVYRHIRHVLSAGFQPISRTNIWHRLLEELANEPVWRSLAARVAEEEERYSARTRAGHRTRNEGGGTGEEARGKRTENRGASPADRSPLGVDVWVPGESFATGREGTSPSSTQEVDSGNADGFSVTTVAPSNHGLESVVEQSNEALVDFGESAVAPGNEGRQTMVAPTNAMYDQFHTTTTTSAGNQNKTTVAVTTPTEPVTAPVTNHLSDLSQAGSGPAGWAPVAGFGPDQAMALRAYAEANGREPSGAEERLLRGVAEEIGGNGWTWIRGAIDEAVDSGSGFVAPKRVREICRRWMAEGLPAEVGGRGMGDEGGGKREEEGGRRTEGEEGRHEGRESGMVEQSEVSEVQPSTSDRSSVSGRVYAVNPYSMHPGAQEPSGMDSSTEDRVGAVINREGSDQAATSNVRPLTSFRVVEAGLGSGQVWSAVLDVLEREGMMRATDVRDYLRDAVLIDRVDARTFVLGVGDALSCARIRQFWVEEIGEAFGMVIGGRGWQVEVVEASGQRRRDNRG